jgi:hypothetical protein
MINKEIENKNKKKIDLMFIIEIASKIIDFEDNDY